ncbi:MAG: hypothetical protein V2A79_02000 [Planctomycetota bacterium]
MTHVPSLLIGFSTAMFVAAGCSGGAGGANVNANDNESEDGGPPPSPRSDGATLVFSPYGLQTPEPSAQNAAFSPDGTRIVFTLFLNGYNEGPAELWIVNVDGGNPHRITPVEDQDSVNVPGAAWNETNDEIVFASDRQDSDDLWAVHPDGTGLRRITTHTTPPYWIEPVWSPDGQWIVFEADTAAATELQQRGTIYKVLSDGTSLTQLTKRNGEDYDDRLPNWSPVGDRILLQRRIPPGDNWDIYAMDTDGNALIDLSNAAEYGNTDSSWSPDGSWIVNSSLYPAGGDELLLPNIVAFFVPAPGSSSPVDPPIRITFSDEQEDGAPSVAPDGQWVAFESHRTDDEESPSDLWIIATPPGLVP